MSTPTILLLEDEPLIAIDVETTLVDMRAGCVKSIASCAEALEWLADNTPDVAVIDIFLRDGECVEVADILVDRNVPFVVHSARSEASHDTHRVFENGIWITKPAIPDDLARAVHLHLSRTNSSAQA
ncbi:response regulator [Agrobacterium rosae]